MPKYVPKCVSVAAGSVGAGLSPGPYTYLFANVFDFVSYDMQIAGFITLLQSFDVLTCLPSPTLADARLGWAGILTLLWSYYWFDFSATKWRNTTSPGQMSERSERMSAWVKCKES